MGNDVLILNVVEITCLVKRYTKGSDHFLLGLDFSNLETEIFPIQVHISLIIQLNFQPSCDGSFWLLSSWN